VRDDGSGIPPAMLPRIFDLFTQVDRGPGGGKGGLGIGLTLVKSLVEMHGGTVTASSAGAGRGSEFVVRLPLVLTPAVVEDEPDEPPAQALTRRRILVVDDNRDAADTLGMVLRGMGAEVRVAYDGSQGLQAFSAWFPAVMLLDIGMPGMDGHEVARRVRQLPGGAEVKLVALTGWGNAEDVRRTREAGFDHHIVKPAEVGALQVLLGSLGATPAPL
jgi:CheY-like chemotaxis protein